MPVYDDNGFAPAAPVARVLIRHPDSRESIPDVPMLIASGKESKLMAQVVCEVGSGLRESEKTVAVADVFNRRHHLRVEEGFLGIERGRYYLPIGIVGLDEAKGRALIELPHESDAGISRLWARQSNLTGIAQPPFRENRARAQIVC